MVTVHASLIILVILMVLLPTLFAAQIYSGAPRTQYPTASHRVSFRISGDR